MGCFPMVDSWLSTLDPLWAENQGSLIRDMISWLLPPSLTFIRKYGKEVIPSNSTNLAKFVDPIFTVVS